MERRQHVEERRQERSPVAPERRFKSRRKSRKFVGSPLPDRRYINVDDEYEVSYWSKELGVSADELKSAVQKAGPSVKAVREYLGR